MAAEGSSASAPRIAQLNDRLRDAEYRVVEIDAQLGQLRDGLVDEADVRSAFADFDNVGAPSARASRGRSFAC